MFPIDRVILAAAVLLLAGIASSKIAARAGVPVLVLFIGVGMLAGSEGVGGIEFEDYGAAHAVGTLALAVILFDGGLRTPLAAVRTAWRPALALATAGVALTAAITGAAAAWLLGLPLLTGVLLGSIVGSTDAAAVFSVLRGRGLRLPERLDATLQVESASNDPMAVFLTVVLIQLHLGQAEWGLGLLGMFAVQMGVGAAVGVAVGKGGVALVNRIGLDSEGIYPVLTGACGLLAYGAAAAVGGSGFLAVYLAGMVLGNAPRLVFRRGTLLFHDGVAWVGQIVMFVVLGLLSFPSRLAAVAVEGLALALVLVFVARPAAVALTLLPFRFAPREVAFLAWAGLKGAVPIILAIFPLLFGVPRADLLFNVVFFAVLVSVVTQGWTLPAVARRLGLLLPPRPGPPVALEISALRDVDAEIVNYGVGPGSRAAGRRLRELALPAGAVAALVARGRETIAPDGATELRPGDHVFVVARRESRAAVDRVFGQGEDGAAGAAEFPLRGGARVAEVEELYGVSTGAAPGLTLDAFLRARLGGPPAPGDRVALDGVVMHVREVSGGRVETVGLEIGGGAPGPPAGDGEGAENGGATVAGDAREDAAAAADRRPGPGAETPG